MKQNPENLSEKLHQPVEQPNPVTPGVTKAMVRQHAFQIYRDKLTNQQLTLQDWVLAEKDLVQNLQTDGLLK